MAEYLKAGGFEKILIIVIGLLGSALLAMNNDKLSDVDKGLTAVAVSLEKVETRLAKDIEKISDRLSDHLEHHPDSKIRVDLSALSARVSALE
jgi:hypothetical protein